MTVVNFLRSSLVLYSVLANICNLSDAQTVGNRLMQTAALRSSSRIAADISTQLYDEYILNEDYTKINLMLLLDSSTSLGEDNFVNGRVFFSWLITMMPKADFRNGRISTAMCTFSASAQLTQEFSFGSIKYRESLRRKIITAAYHNGTSTDLSTSLVWIDASFNSATRPTRPQEKNILIIATDGKSTDSSAYPTSLSYMVSELQASDVQIFVVALGTNLDLETLGTLTSGDTKRLYPLRNRRRTAQIGSRLARLVTSS